MIVLYDSLVGKPWVWVDLTHDIIKEPKGWLNVSMLKKCILVESTENMKNPEQTG